MTEPYTDVFATLNDKGRVVGTIGSSNAEAATGAQRGNNLAPPWNDNVPVNLNDLVDSNDPRKPYVTFRQATRISNRGHILAFGYDSRVPFSVQLPFLLTTIGE